MNKNEMNSREKSIEALNIIYNDVTEENLQDRTKEYQLVLNCINKPTLDDAIKVVEGELILAEEYVMGLKSKDVPASIFWKYQGQVIALQSILTTLNDMKEGKK